MTLTISDSLKYQGMQLALSNAPEWSERADTWFESIPSGSIFTSEDLISAVGLPQTAEYPLNRNNAVGAKMRSWAGQTEEVGFRKTTRVTSHSRRIIVWSKK